MKNIIVSCRGLSGKLLEIRRTGKKEYEDGRVQDEYTVDILNEDIQTMHSIDNVYPNEIKFIMESFNDQNPKSEQQN